MRIDARLAQFLDQRQRSVQLLVATDEDHRTVLGADVISLTIERRRVVDDEKDFQQIAITQDSGIELDAHNLGMPGTAFANLTIGRMLDMTTRIAGRYRMHAFDLTEYRLQAPETAPAQHGRFEFRAFY
ncbi:hypothetical protein SDC9_155165 [bioreactor metagenome]|uniref:Uncharacterized protein n=1 Tax=bioreactor metagenome TaxID=1076179 RepID=A0A645F5Q8_9ZZZZ